MQETEFKRIKQRILSVNPAKYWGDDFDVRYYAISKLKETKNQLILDAGGGIGIISSEMDESNSCVNLDLNLSELILCKTKMSNTTSLDFIAHLGSAIFYPKQVMFDERLLWKSRTVNYFACSHAWATTSGLSSRSRPLS